jgi:hypothetical protein
MGEEFRCTCGSDDFEIIMYVHDEVLFSAIVYKDGTVDTVDFLKDYCGDDNELADHVECRDCGKIFDLTSDGPKERNMAMEDGRKVEI